MPLRVPVLAEKGREKRPDGFNSLDANNTAETEIERADAQIASGMSFYFSFQPTPLFFHCSLSLSIYSFPFLVYIPSLHLLFHLLPITPLLVDILNGLSFSISRPTMRWTRHYLLRPLYTLQPRHLALAQPRLRRESFASRSPLRTVGQTHEKKLSNCHIGDITFDVACMLDSAPLPDIIPSFSARKQRKKTGKREGMKF